MTYDKLETKNLFSPHFGECRYGKIVLEQDPDSDLMLGCDAAKLRGAPESLRHFYLCTGLLGLPHEALHSVLTAMLFTGTQGAGPSDREFAMLQKHVKRHRIGLQLDCQALSHAC